MFDPMTAVLVVGAVSGAGAIGAGAMALKTHVTLEKERRAPEPDVLEQAFPPELDDIPADMRALLDRLN